METHGRDHAAGTDAVVESRPALEIGILAFGQHVLVSGIVGLLVGHPAATFNTDGVAARKVGLHVCAVSTALIVTALEVLVFKKGNLCGWS